MPEYVVAITHRKHKVLIELRGPFSSWESAEAYAEMLGEGEQGQWKVEVRHIHPAIGRGLLGA